MKLITLSALVSIAAGATNAHALDLREHSSSQQTLHFEGSGTHTLEVRAISGAITVEAYDGKDVEVIINKTIYSDTPDDRERANREVTIDTTENAGTISLIVRHQDGPICGEKSKRWTYWDERHYDVRHDFTIRVPKDTRLELCTINSGDVVVTGTQGDFSIRTINGRITMTEVSGSGDATTINGRVTAAFAATPRSASLFKTVNGDVVLEMPNNLAADLRLKTFNGGLFTDFDVEPLQQAMNVSMQRQGEKFVYRSNGFTSVRAGGGGPQLTLQTLNGDVRVLRHTN